MATWKKVVVSGSNAELNTLRATSVTASLFGTASYAVNALTSLSSSFATTASYALNAGGSQLATGSFATTGSNTFVGNQIVSGAVDITGVLTVQNSITTPAGQYFVVSSDTSTEMSWQVPFAPSIPVSAGVFTGPSGVAIGNTSTDGAGNALPTKNWLFGFDGNLTAPGAVSASSFTGSLQGTASIAVTSSYAAVAVSASFATNASSSNFALTALSSSRAESAGTVDSISGNITNNVNNRVITANGNGTVNGEANLTFDGTTLDVNGSVVISQDLTVNGTTTFINTQNLYVEDRFVLLASGSATATDGGIVISAAADGNGFGFGYDASADRWALEDAMNPTASAFSATPTSYIVSAQSSTGAPATDPAYGGSTTGWGNIHVDTNTGEIFIYS